MKEIGRSSTGAAVNVKSRPSQNVEMKARATRAHRAAAPLKAALRKRRRKNSAKARAFLLHQRRPADIGGSDRNSGSKQNIETIAAPLIRGGAAHYRI